VFAYIGCMQKKYRCLSQCQHSATRKPRCRKESAWSRRCYRFKVCRHAPCPL